MWRALTLLKQCHSAVKRGKAGSGPTFVAWCKMLPGGGCWGLSNMLKAREILGKGQQLCRLSKHFSWQQNPAANCFTDTRLRGRITSSAPSQLWQRHEEYSWMWRASWYGTRLDKTPNALLAGEASSFPHCSVLCVCRHAVLQQSCAQNRGAWAAAMQAQPPGQSSRKYKTRSILLTVQIKQQNGIKRHVPCHQLMDFCPYKHDNIFRLLMLIQQDLHLISWSLCY